MDSINFMIKTPKTIIIEINLVTKEDNTRIWHKRFEHLDYAELHHLSRAC